MRCFLVIWVIFLINVVRVPAKDHAKFKWKLDLSAFWTPLRYDIEVVLGNIFCHGRKFLYLRGRKGLGISEQDWGHVNIGDNGHMFWWLFYTSATPNYTARPLIIWLQGGPGESASGFGNFMEIGPLDLDLNPRVTSWHQYANILFVDNPLGAGFSYVSDINTLPRTNCEIANDFVIFLKGFYKKLPQFEQTPLHIFSESYGGKMAVEIALAIQIATQNKTLKTNLKTIGLGDSWLDPYEIISHWPDYLWYLGAAGSEDRDHLKKLTRQLKNKIDSEQWVKSYDQWLAIEDYIFDFTHTNFYNILTKTKSMNSDNPEFSEFINIISKRNSSKQTNEASSKEIDSVLENIMNGDVKKILKINTTYYGSQQRLAHKALIGDFMKPVTKILERVLNETDIEVVIYNGQLDLICATPGVLTAVENMKWKNASKWLKVKRKAFTVDGVFEGFVKSFGKLSFYWVNRAGHMLPKDNPAAMNYILRRVTNDFEV